MVIRSGIFLEFVLAVMVIAAILLFICARFFRFSNKTMAIITAFVLLSTGILWSLGLYFQHFLSGILQSDSFNNRKSLAENVFYIYEPGAMVLSLLVLLMGFLVSIYNAEYLRKEQRQHAFYPLMLMMFAGIIGMVWAVDLLIVYLFSELMNICAYALVAFRRKSNAAIEAGFKYLMMSSVASVIVFAGISILFYTEGSILISDIHVGKNGLSQLGALFILSGFCLKSAIVPLHTWLPDAHGKAPSSISALLSGVLVQSVFYVMIRIILSIGLPSLLVGNLLLIFALLNIIVGNLMGIIQVNLKRMLGYSTIAQMGYIVLCFAIGLRNRSVLALQSGFFIIIAHALTKGLAFLEAGTFYLYEGVNEIREIRSLKNHPLFTMIVLTVAIMSLSAIPPFPGFTGKWTALTSVFTAHDPLAVWITLAFLLGSVTAFGYYLPLLVNLSGIIFRHKQQSNNEKPEKKISIWMKVPAALLAISIILIIISPQMIFSSTLSAAQFLLEIAK
jgi:proton-translocating NADH-quinone oxidoreductase chain N